MAPVLKISEGYGNISITVIYIHIMNDVYHRVSRCVYNVLFILGYNISSHMVGWGEIPQLIMAISLSPLYIFT